MTGPEHYCEADLLLTGESSSCEYGCPHSGCAHEMRLIARAQAHATLALAAAVAFNGETCASEADGWWNAAGTKPGDAL